MNVRNIFDQYEQPESRLTHALVSCLVEDRKLLREVHAAEEGLEAGHSICPIEFLRGYSLCFYQLTVLTGFLNDPNAGAVLGELTSAFRTFY